AANAGGQDVYHAEANSRAQVFYSANAFPEADTPYRYHEEIVSVPLKNLVRGVETAAVLRGRLRLTLPTRVDRVRFERLTTGATRQSGSLEVTLQVVQPGSGAAKGSAPTEILPRSFLALTHKGTTRGQPQAVFADAQGRSLGANAMLGTAWSL